MRSNILILVLTLILAHGASAQTPEAAVKYGVGKWAVELNGGATFPAVEEYLDQYVYFNERETDAYHVGGAVTRRTGDHLGFGFGVDYAHADTVEKAGNYYSSSRYDTTTDQYTVSLMARLYGGTGRFQPYLGLGAGVLHRSMKTDYVSSFNSQSGPMEYRGSFGDSATAAMVEPALGLDIYVTESLFIGMQTSYLLPLPVGEESIGIDQGGLSAGARIGFVFGGE